MSEFFKYCSAVCDVKNWNELEPLLNTSPNFCWYSAYDVTTVGTKAGPLRVGPITTAPILATADGKNVWSISFVNTPGEITFSAIEGSPN